MKKETAAGSGSVEGMEAVLHNSCGPAEQPKRVNINSDNNFPLFNYNYQARYLTSSSLL